jgi:hypothetical protein
MLANNKVIAEKIDDIFEEVVKEEPKQAVGGDNVVSFEERKKKK